MLFGYAVAEILVHIIYVPVMVLHDCIMNILICCEYNCCTMNTKEKEFNIDYSSSPPETALLLLDYWCSTHSDYCSPTIA